MKLSSSKRFEEDLSNLTEGDKKYYEKVRKTLRLFVVDMNYPSLRRHKLAGKEIYSISVDMKIRILIQIDGDEIYLLRIGTHDEAY